MEELDFSQEEQEQIRASFPMLSVEEGGHPLIYFNNAATALTPQPVIAAMTDYYEHYGVNIARGVDAVGYEATARFEKVRQQVADFIGAGSADEIVFTRGTTASLNLVATALGEGLVKPGDEIIVSTGEHHANYIPWQQLALRRKARLIIAPTGPDGAVTPATLGELLTDKTKLVALFHTSNVMGATHDIKSLAALAHSKGAYFVCDGAQGIVHQPVNVRDLDVDFYAFSGHKLFGPTGIGVLYGKKDLLQRMPPVEFGGEMIDSVELYETSFAEPPHRFEAGTMPIAEVIGLGAALDFVDRWGKDRMNRRTQQLTAKLLQGLKEVPGIHIYNEMNSASGIVCFNVEGVHPHDAAGVYDRAGISLRAGQHCSQPAMRSLCVQATLRASLNFYNTEAEIDRFVEVSREAGDFLDVLF